jgi:hypothetical protein
VKRAKHRESREVGEGEGKATAKHGKSINKHALLKNQTKHINGHGF